MKTITITITIPTTDRRIQPPHLAHTRRRQQRYVVEATIHFSRAEGGYWGEGWGGLESEWASQWEGAAADNYYVALRSRPEDVEAELLDLAEAMADSIRAGRRQVVETAFGSRAYSGE